MTLSEAISRRETWGGRLGSDLRNGGTAAEGGAAPAGSCVWRGVGGDEVSNYEKLKFHRGLTCKMWETFPRSTDDLQRIATCVGMVWRSAQALGHPPGLKQTPKQGHS